MTNSHLLGWITFGSFLVLAAAVWWFGPRYGAAQGWTRRGATIAALLFVAFGAAFGWFAFTVDNRMRIITLYEEMVESRESQTITFTVEHPGIAHSLFLSPSGKSLLTTLPPAKLTFSLAGPDGAMVMPERTESFGVRTNSESGVQSWDGRSFPFTPPASGLYTLRLIPISPEIPRIHVRVEDPEKRDGKRMPGY